jgi:hypothetical protein
MNLNKTSIGALTLSSLLMMSSTPAYAVPTITIGMDSSVSDVIIELMYAFEINFCTDPLNPSGDPTCNFSLKVMNSSADIRDEIVNSGSAAVGYDLFISANPDPSDLYYKYQFRRYPNQPNVVPNVEVGKPFQFASDSVILYSMFPGVGIDLSSGFPKHLGEGVTFAMPDPVTDAYGAVSAQILASSPNLKSALNHAQTEFDAGTAWAAVEFYNPTDSFGSPFGFVPKSAVCKDLQYTPQDISIYDFSQQENLKKINSVKLNGVSIGKKRNKEEDALLNSFISYITGQNNGNGNADTAAYILQNNYCYVPITAKKETKVQPH